MNHEHAQGAVRARLLDSSPHQRGRRERVEHLAMRLTSNRAHALRPVRSAQGIEQFRAGLNEPAPEALSSRVAGGGKGVHSDPPPASRRHRDHLQHRAPYHVVDGRAEHCGHVRVRAKLQAVPRRTVDPFRNQAQARHVEGAVDIDRRRRARQPQSTAILYKKNIKTYKKNE